MRPKSKGRPSACKTETAPPFRAILFVTKIDIRSTRWRWITFFFFFFDDETDTTVPVSVEDGDIDNPEELEFFNNGIRKVWHRQDEEWYFSIVDVCQVLTGSDRPRKYWNDLKAKLIDEGSELSAKIGRLKMPAADGKMRLTDLDTNKE